MTSAAVTGSSWYPIRRATSSATSTSRTTSGRNEGTSTCSTPLSKASVGTGVEKPNGSRSRAISASWSSVPKRAPTRSARTRIRRGS